MEKRPVVYTRRPRKPLSDLPPNASNVYDDPGSGLSLVACADKDGTKCTTVAKKNRKSWIDRSLSNKGRRSSMSWGEEFNLSHMAYKWVGTLFRREGEKQGKCFGDSLRNQTIKKPVVVQCSLLCAERLIDKFKDLGSRPKYSYLPNSSPHKKIPKDNENGIKWLLICGSQCGKHQQMPALAPVYPANRNKKVNPPVEFVKEKQAMFAEIDSFELESEEESPAPKPRSQEWIKERLDVSKEASFRRCALAIVPEDEFEEFVDSLSAALRTPHLHSNHACSQELSSQSPSCQPRPSQSSLQNSDITRNLLLDSEDFSSPTTSLSSDDLANEYCTSNSEILKVSSDLSVGFDRVSPTTAEKKRSSLDCNALVAKLGSIQLEEDGRILCGGQCLNSLVEEEEENSDFVKNEGAQNRDSFQRSGEILLETRAEDLLPIFEALLDECHQTEPLSLRDAIADFCDLSEMVKLGEGTFGEAFKGGGCVFKIVPMDGNFLVNSEVQKTSAEIYSEVLLTNTLNRFRGLDLQDSTNCANYCTNFIETKAIRICQGSYEVELCLAWEEWDAIRISDNDHPMLFPQHQLYVVFVLADGGKDLETFVLSDFNEAQSLLLQVVLALAVAEEGCGFEHRDLHWGNIVLAKDQEKKCVHYKLCDKVLKVETYGLSVSIIDFTLSRIDTGKHVFFCNLSADPALFEGPSRDAQADTYRRMLNLTKGNWEGSFPQTNCYWIHYLADVLIKKKSYHCSSQEKRALRSFCKRVLLYESAKAAVSDDFFRDLWIQSSE